jgi:hypothetical protein
MTDGPQGRTAEFADAFGKGVSHRKDLIALFIQKQMVIAEVRSRHVPVEVLGLDVERKGVRKQQVQRRRYVTRCIRS